MLGGSMYIEYLLSIEKESACIIHCYSITEQAKHIDNVCIVADGSRTADRTAACLVTAVGIYQECKPGSDGS